MTGQSGVAQGQHHQDCSPAEPVDKWYYGVDLLGDIILRAMLLWGAGLEPRGEYTDLVGRINSHARLLLDSAVQSSVLQQRCRAQQRFNSLY